LPTNLYGPGDNYHPTNSHVLPALIRRFHEAAQAQAPWVSCWGTGAPLMEFFHVNDRGEACVFALEHWQPGPEDQQFLNVGTGVDLTIRELVEAVAAATGFPGRDPLKYQQTRWHPEETFGCEPSGSPGLAGADPAGGGIEEHSAQVSRAAQPATSAALRG